jgi:hypothetical protein
VFKRACLYTLSSASWIHSTDLKPGSVRFILVLSSKFGTGPSSFQVCTHFFSSPFVLHAPPAYRLSACLHPVCEHRRLDTVSLHFCSCFGSLESLHCWSCVK